MSIQVNKNEWVQIHNIVLTPEERAPQVPEDTKKVPLELWVKGYLINDATLGEHVEIKTITGRIVSGKLVEVNPSYSHSYGKYVPELGMVREQIKLIMSGGDGV